MTKKISMSLFGSMCLFVFLFLFTSNAVFADDNNSVVDLINITVPQSCSVEGIIASGGEHTKTVQNNQYYSEIGTTTFKTYCNDSGGYAIYAIGYSNDEYGNTLMKHSTNSSLDFDTGTNTSGNTSDWSMKLSPVTGTYAPTIHSDTSGAFSAYHIVPSTYTKVVSFPSNTDLPATGVNATGSGFTSTYAAWISATQGAGTYTGKVKYTLVHPSTEIVPQPQPSTPGYINYYANSNTALGSMGAQSATDGSTVTLLASNFSRDGYGFAGWSDAFDYATNANAHFYGPNEDITVPTGTTANGLSLYAIWIESAGNFQDASKVSMLCGTGTGSLTQAPTNGSKTLASVSALTDLRDNQTYAIAKLPDGKCWMIENLRLEAEDSLGNDALFSQGYATNETYGNFIGLPNSENNHFSTTAYANSIYYSGTQSGTASIDVGAASNPAFRIPRFNHTNTYSRASSPATNEASIYSYGNYYTWAAAVANTSVLTSNNALVNTTSICPTGWRLPTGGGVTSSVNATGNPNTFREYYRLGYLIMGSVANDDTPNSGKPYYTSTVNANGDIASAAFRKYPLNFIFAGNIGDATIASRGVNGTYWSSASNNYSRSYAFNLGVTDTYPGTSDIGKRFGRSVRCVASI